MQKLIIALSFVLLISSALACKPDLEREIQFGQNSSTIEQWQIQDLIDWYANVKDPAEQTGGIQELGIYAKAARGSEKSMRLARERIANISHLLEGESGVAAPKLMLDLKQFDRMPNYTDDAVQVWVQPNCAKTHSCCP